MHLIYLLVAFVILLAHAKNIEKPNSSWFSAIMPVAAIVVAPPLAFASFYAIGDALAGESFALAFGSVGCLGAGGLALNTHA